MLKLNIPRQEIGFDDSAQEFIFSDAVVLELEHSLVSLSKWEEIWEKPFLSAEQHSTEETYSYIQCMSLNGEVSLDVIQHLSDDSIAQINKYIEAKMSATWFNEPATKQTSVRNKEVITAEVLYHLMISYNIPIEWETRHLNRLLTLLRVFSIKNSTEKKKPQSQRDMIDERKRLNEQRKAQLKTRG